MAVGVDILLLVALAALTKTVLVTALAAAG
jgi:hypothetical protein